MEQPRRIDRPADSPSDSQFNASRARKLSSYEQKYLRGLIGLTISLSGESVFASQTVAVDDLWVERSMIPIERTSSQPPNDDPDSPGLPITELVGGAAGSVTFLVGEEGAGKSAVCQYLSGWLAANLIKGEGSIFPIFVSATAIFSQSADDPLAMLAAAAESTLGANVARDAISDMLSNIDGPVAIFIDGLDVTLLEEGGEKSSRAVGGLLRSLQRSLPTARMIATCRQEAWFDPRFTIHHLGQAYYLRLLRMRDIVAIIHQWWEVKGGYNMAPGLLVQQIAADRHLSGLCRIPLMLSLALAVVDRKGTLPNGAGGLCEEISDVCIEALGTGNRGLRDSERLLLGAVLQALAWKVTQTKDNTVNRDEAVGVISASEIRDIVTAAVDDDIRSSRIRSSPKTIDYFALLRDGIGIFGGLTADRFGFRHDVFRLFFAGQYLAQLPNPDPKLLANQVNSPSILVWAQGRAYRGKIDSVLILIEEIFESGETGVQRLLACELFATIFRHALSSRTQWINRWMSRVKAEAASIRSSSSYGVQDRMRAGDVLAEIGDPLLESIESLDTFLPVPARKVSIGRKLPETTTERPSQRIHWAATRQVSIRDFRVAKYPVTNLEFSRFIDAGGYERPELWLERSGRRWLEQDQTLLDEAGEVVVASLGVHYKNDVEGEYMSLPDHSNLTEEFCRDLLIRDRPMYWTDGRFNQANQPVVGINWWEATAYCAWLTETLLGKGRISTGERCRLLSEEEWEYCAGGGTGQAYPWGQYWDDAMAHVRTTSKLITRSIAIGAFPSSSSIFGLECLVGNVWEWCGSTAEQPYGLFRVTGPLADRATRGSSWLTREPLARDVSFRSFDPPCNAYVDVGFRIAIAKSD